MSVKFVEMFGPRALDLYHLCSENWRTRKNLGLYSRDSMPNFENLNGAYSGTPRTGDLLEQGTDNFKRLIWHCMRNLHNLKGDWRGITMLLWRSFANAIEKERRKYH